MVSGASVPSSLATDLVSELRTDPRWKLVERILLTSPFQKSTNLHALLQYLAEFSIRNEFASLTERQIGIAVFGKPDDYTPAEDSAVRVHVRQLRLRLHEFFALEGRNEELVVDMPKGSYILQFHPAHAEAKLLSAGAPLASESKIRSRRLHVRDVLLMIATGAAAFLGVGWYRTAYLATSQGAVPWPLNALIQPNQDTHIVVSDGNSMVRLLGDHEITLEEYLQPGFRAGLIPRHNSANMSRLFDYISGSQLTSFADLFVTSSLVRMAGNRCHLIFNSANSLNQRELEDGNYIFLGSQMSNPWVSLFTDKLNFKVVEDGGGGKMYFRNWKPLPGEQANYDGLSHTGGTGEDYATISLLPSSNGHGQVLILQGLRQEGTEALGELLSNAEDRNQLKRALGIEGDPRTPVYFEALIRTRAVVGAPVSVSVVASRRISDKDAIR